MKMLSLSQATNEIVKEVVNNKNQTNFIVGNSLTIMTELLKRSSEKNMVIKQPSFESLTRQCLSRC